MQENKKVTKETTNVEVKKFAKDFVKEDLKNLDSFRCKLEKLESNKKRLRYVITFFIGKNIVKEMSINETVYNLLVRKYKLDNKYNVHQLVVRGRIFYGIPKSEYFDIWVRVQIVMYPGKTYQFFLKDDELELYKMDLADHILGFTSFEKLSNGEIKEKLIEYKPIFSEESIEDDYMNSYMEPWQIKE